MHATDLQNLARVFRWGARGAIVTVAMWGAACGTTLPLSESRKGKENPGGPVEPRGCMTPLGELKDGGKAYGFLRAKEPFGKSCEKGVVHCNDGIWTGDHVYPECKTESEVDL